MKNSREEGISTIEALVAVAVIVAAGAALFAGASGTIQAAASARQSTKAAADLLTTDELLRREIGRVRIPLWAGNAFPSEEGTAITLPWYDGERTKGLRIAGTEDGILLQILEGSAAVSIGTTVRGRMVAIRPTRFGLEIRYTIAGREYRTEAAFGAIPLTAVAEKP